MSSLSYQYFLLLLKFLLIKHEQLYMKLTQDPFSAQNTLFSGMLLPTIHFEKIYN
jgi:hypothetical protein